MNRVYTICFSNKHVVNPTMLYKLDGHILNRVHHHPYPGVTLSSDLKWANHVAKTTTSAKQTLGVIRRALDTPKKSVKLDCTVP